MVEWHPVLNAGVDPKTITPQSHVNAWWKCPAGHEYQDVVQHRFMNGAGCRRCKDESSGSVISFEDSAFQLVAEIPEAGKIDWVITKDGEVNCTKICKAFGKRLDVWKKSDHAQELLKAFSRLHQTVVSAIGRRIKGGNNKNIQGTYYPPDIAIQIVQWCDPYFALYVSRAIRQLFLTGKIELGKEKSSEELDAIWKKKVEELVETCKKLENEREAIKETLLDTESKLNLAETEISTLQIRLEKTKEKQNYPSLAEGCCVYICHDADKPGDTFKVGKSEDVGKTLRGYRRNAPRTLLDHVVYLSRRGYSKVEECIKTRYFKQRDPNHEVITGVPLQELIQSVNHTIEFLRLNNKSINLEDLDAYNNYIKVM
jgi:hypothetical protein